LKPQRHKDTEKAARDRLQCDDQRVFDDKVESGGGKPLLGRMGRKLPDVKIFCKKTKDLVDEFARRCKVYLLIV
jgi:hypothetical protein